MTQKQYAEHSGLTSGRVSQLVKQGMPLTSAAAADKWRGTSARKRKATAKAEAAEPGPYRPPEAKDPPNPETANEDGPHGAYERQRLIEREAYTLARSALRANQPDAGRMVSVHAQAARNLTQARQEVLDLAERERRLVSGDWVKGVMLQHDGAMAALLKAMPKRLACRISPHDPEHAERELDNWVQEVALKTLSSTDPWR